jgi:Ion transport protein
MSVATVWQTLIQISSGTGPSPSETDGYVDSFWGVVELSFTIFFTVEVILKLICYGWRQYWSDITNRFAVSAFLYHISACTLMVR